MLPLSYLPQGKKDLSHDQTQSWYLSMHNCMLGCGTDLILMLCKPSAMAESIWGTGESTGKQRCMLSCHGDQYKYGSRGLLYHMDSSSLEGILSPDHNVSEAQYSWNTCFKQMPKRSCSFQGSISARTKDALIGWVAQRMRTLPLHCCKCQSERKLCPSLSCH